jgi:hypothetical protein
MTLHNKHKVICHALIIAVTILMLGYSSVFAFPFQSTIHHHKVFDKKQDIGGSNSLHRKSSDNSNNEGNSVNNNNRGTNDDRRGSDNNLQAVEPAKTHEQQQRSGENVAPTGIATPTPETTCEQGSNCTDQQGLSDRDRFTTASDNTTEDNTPFVLSLPFP